MEQKEFDFLSLPTKELLEKFGEGRHIPGSGSAAAFSALLAVELLRTVCKLTINRNEEKYLEVRKEVSLILEQLEETSKPKLIELFKKDIQIFNLVSEYRIERNKAKAEGDEKEERKFARLATEKLREATEIPLEIARLALSLSDYGFVLFEKGFQSARGDSGVAISNLLSAASGSLFVTLINIRTGRQSQWTEKLRGEAEDIGKIYQTKHKLALAKVFDLYKEGINNEEHQLKLFFDSHKESKMYLLNNYQITKHVDSEIS